MRQISASRMQEIIAKPSIFSQDILDITPFDYQIPYMDDMHEKLINRGGRQYGKTTMSLIKLLHLAWLLPHVKTVYERVGKILILSSRLDQAIALVEKMQHIIHHSDILPYYLITDNKTRIDIRWCGYPYKKKEHFTTIQPVAAGDDGDASRSYVSNGMLFDETGSISDEVYYAAEPGSITTDRTVLMVGTPSKKPVGIFYDKCMDSKLITNPGVDEIMKRPPTHGRDKDTAWRQYNGYTLQNPRVTKDKLKEYRSWPQEKYEREIMGIFPQSGGLLFDRKDLNACMTEYTGDKTGAMYYGGVDVALGGNDTVLCVIGVKDSTEHKGRDIWVEYINGRATSTILEVADDIRDLDSEFDLTECAVDATGVGQGVVDILDYGGVIVEPIKFSQYRKIQIYMNLVRLVNQTVRTDMGNLYLGKEDTESGILMEQMMGISEEDTPSGGARIKSAGADDYPDALALACWMCRETDSWGLWVDEKNNAQGFGSLFSGKQKRNQYGM